MRAATFTGPRTIEVQEVPVTDPGPGEVAVRLEGCGLCGSNLPVWEGRPWFSYPLEPGAPGHEGWGRVDALGPNVAELGVGDAVALLSSRSLAEHEVVPAHLAVPIPAELVGRPFPGEALGCGANVFRRSFIESGSTVAVVGVGFLGSVVLQLAVAAGATVVAIGRRRSALAHAGKAGAKHLLEWENGADVRSAVQDITNGRGCDVVIEAVGAQEALDLSTELTTTRGRLVIAGYHQDGSRTVDMQQWNWRGLDVINAHEREPAVYRRGVEEAAAAILEGRLDPEPLYTDFFALDEVGSALETMADRPDGFMKALVRL